MAKRHGGKGMKNVKDSLTKGAKDAQNDSTVGIYSDEAELLDQLKRIALDPCRLEFARDNIQPLCSKILSFRKAMLLKDFNISWRKRKIEQLFKDEPRTPCGIVLPNPQHSTKVRRQMLSNGSSVDCLLNSADSTLRHDGKTIFDSRTSSILTVDHALMEKQVSIERSSVIDIDHWNCPSEAVSPSVDTNESVNGSNPSSPEKQVPNVAPAVENRDVIHRLNSSNSNGAQRRHIKPPRLSAWLLSSISDNVHQRKVIPVGPRFQADVPEWSGTVNRSTLAAYKNESGNSKWLGSRVWPIDIRNKKTTEKVIGKGRPNSCSCALPGSAACSKHHTSAKRLRLQHDIGAAFYSWKFDEKGEQVSKSWPLKDQNAFESLVKMKPSSDGKDFVKRSLKRFPNKSRKEIINYYFNVYIPNRMSIQTRLPSIKEVDTDDDEDEVQDSMYLGMQKKTEKETLKVRNSKDVKRYLRS